MNRRSPRRQLAFEFPPMIRMALSRESDEVYIAVLLLRFDGDSVFRAGTGQHRVSGRQYSTRRLIDLARSRSRQPATLARMRDLGFNFDREGQPA